MTTNILFAPPHFKFGEDFNEFEKMFKSYCDGIGASPELRKHMFLQSICEETKWEMNDGNGSLYSVEYEALLEKARQANGGHTRTKKLQFDIFNRVQNPNENIRSYVRSLSAIGNLAYPTDTQKEVKNHVLYHTLLRGVNNRRAAQIVQQEDVKKPLVDFVSAARRIITIEDDSGKENLFHDYTAPSKSRDPQFNVGAHVVSQERPLLTSDQSMLHDIQLSLSNMNDRLTSIEQHNTAPVRKMPPMSPNDTNQPWRRNNSQIKTCYNCQEPGHFKRNCPKLQFKRPTSYLHPFNQNQGECHRAGHQY